MAGTPRPLYAADVKEALAAIRKVMNGKIVDNLVDAFTFVPDNLMLAPDVNQGLTVTSGSETPPTSPFQSQTPVTLVAKC